MQTVCFSELDLIEPIQRAIRAQNYTHPTPIQSQAIPPLLAGRDLLGCAQTGTGKTAAFALPMLQYLSQNPRHPSPRHARSIVLTPTRELAAQIAESFRVYGRELRLTRTVVFGGVGQHPQVQAMSRGVDILVATPGRLLDLINQGHIRLGQIEVFVLDEADRMLDMGFIHDVRKVIAMLPARRQSLFFSATMPPSIVDLASSLLTDPVSVHVAPQQTTAERIDQRVLFVDRANKVALLRDMLQDAEIHRALVFTRTKHGANKVVKHLEGFQISSDAIHGNKSQSARTQALNNFRAGRIRVLVATDIAARGIDVDGVTHVINFDLPNEPESYVHRIGRTARAGASGKAVSFCDAEEHAYLRDIERLIRIPVPVFTDHPYHVDPPLRIVRPPQPGRSARPQGRPPQGRSGPRPGGGPAAPRERSRYSSDGPGAPRSAPGGDRSRPLERIDRFDRGGWMDRGEDAPRRGFTPRPKTGR